MAEMRSPDVVPQVETDQRMCAGKYQNAELPSSKIVKSFFYLARSSATYCTPTSQISTQHIHIPLINRRANMIEFSNEGMFEPVHQHLRNHHRYDRLSHVQKQTLSSAPIN